MAEENLNIDSENLDFTGSLNEISADAFAAPVDVNPPAKKNDNFLDGMNNVVNNSFKSNFAPPAYSSVMEKMNAPVGPKTKYAGPELDMYRFQDDFNSYTFNPYSSTNYERWADDQGWGDALSKGFDGFASRFGHTFVDYWKGYGRMFDALIHWDAKLLEPSEAQMIEYNHEEHKKLMEDYVFIPQNEQDDIFNKQFVSEFISNAGFALGTFAGVAIEIGADILISFLSAGSLAAPVFGATATRLGAKGVAKAVGKEAVEQTVKRGVNIGTVLSDIGKGYTMADKSADGIRAAATLKKADQASDVSKVAQAGNATAREIMEDVFRQYSLNFKNIATSKSFGEFAQNFIKGVPLVGTGIQYGEKIAAGAKAGLSGGQLVGMGIKGLRRIGQEFNLASTEASFEGVSTYGDTLDKMVAQYRQDNNGNSPTADEFVKMQRLAMEASFKNYGTNLAILLATNRMQFGALFSRFAGANKLMKEFAEEGIEDVLKVNRMFKSSPLLAKAYQKTGFFGTYGLIGQVAKDFGKKQAVYELGKKLVKDFGKFQVVEGLQENLQETSNSAWKNYYASQYAGQALTLSDAFAGGLGEQWGKQGIKTFLMGAMTGGLIHGPTRISQKILGKAQEAAVNRKYKDSPDQNPYQQAKDNLARELDLVNSTVAMMNSKIKKEESVSNFTNTVQTVLDQSEAAAKNNQYEFQNASDNLLLNTALAANRSGTINMYVNALRDAGVEMTAEEFKAEFGVDLTGTKYSSPAQFLNQVADDLKKYSNIVDNIRRKSKNLIDPSMFEKNSKERAIASMLQSVQEDAIKIVALNRLKATRASERAQSVAKEVAAIPGMAQSSDYAFRVLANSEMFAGELGQLESEIKLLEQTLQDQALTPELRTKTEQELKDKKEELDLYNQWLSFWGDRDVVQGKVKAEPGKEKRNAFVGKKFQRQKKDEKGKFTKEKEDAWNLKDDSIAEVFRKFINLRNKKAGLSTEISEEDLRDAFDKIVDFIQLEKDGKDYLEAVDALSNPKYYSQLLERMMDGKLKKQILDWTEHISGEIVRLATNLGQMSAISQNFESVEDYFKAMQDVYEELETAVLESDAYKNLIAITINNNLGIDQWSLATDSVKEIQQILENKIFEISQRYDPTAFDDVSDEEYKRFKAEGKVSDSVKNIIAQKLFRGEPLSDKQKEIYDAFKEEIDNKVKTLKDAVQKRRSEKRTRAGKTYESGKENFRGGESKFLYVLDTDDRSFDDIIEYYGQDMSKVNLLEMVEKAIANNHVHPYIKQLLIQLKPFIDPSSQAEINSEQTYAPGYYNSETNLITLDPTIADIGISFEAVLAHELIHYMTSTELHTAPNGELATAVQRLFDHAKTTLEKAGLDTNFYGFTNLHEFLAEAYTNPAFQQELQKVRGITGEKSLWEEFLNLLAAFLKKAFNINMQESVLDDVFRTFEEHIGSKPGSYTKQKLVSSGVFSVEQVQTMTDEEAIDTAIKQNIVTPEELAGLMQPKEEISNEEWEAFYTEQKISEERVNSLASKRAHGDKLTTRELAMYNANSAEIDALVDTLLTNDVYEGEYGVEYQEGVGYYLTKGGIPITDATTDEPLFFENKAEAEAYIKTAQQTSNQDSENADKDKSNKTISSDDQDAVDEAGNKPPTQDQLDDEFLKSQLGEKANTPDETPKGLFNVFGDADTGYEIRTEDDKVIVKEIPTKDKADALVEDLTNDRANIEFALSYLSKNENGIGDYSENLSLFLDRAKFSLDEYNKGKKGKAVIKTLGEYSKIPNGKKDLETIKRSVEEGLSVEEILEKEKTERKEIISQGGQLNLFETTTSETGETLTLESLQKLDERLQSVKTTTTTAPSTQKPKSATTKKAEMINKRADIEEGLEIDGVIPKYGEHRSAIPTLTETLYDENGNKVGTKQYVGEEEVSTAKAKGVIGTTGNNPAARRTRTKAIKIGNKNYKADVELYPDGTAIYNVSEVNASGIAIKTLSEDQYKEVLVALGEEPVVKAVSPTDKIIWAHPGLGKTTFRNANPENVLDFDTDFKPEVAKQLGLPEGQRDSVSLNAWRKKSKANEQKFETVMKKVWQEAVQQSRKTGKMLLVSDMMFLRENANDFDKIITTDRETFNKRASQRGDDVSKLESWKSNIDKTIAGIDQSKVVSTNKYFAELAALEGTATSNADLQKKANQVLLALSIKPGTTLLEDSGDFVKTQDGVIYKNIKIAIAAAFGLASMVEERKKMSPEEYDRRVAEAKNSASFVERFTGVSEKRNQILSDLSREIGDELRLERIENSIVSAGSIYGIIPDFLTVYSDKTIKFLSPFEMQFAINKAVELGINVPSISSLVSAVLDALNDYNLETTTTYSKTTSAVEGFLRQRYTGFKKAKPDMTNEMLLEMGYPAEKDDYSLSELQGFAKFALGQMEKSNPDRFKQYESGMKSTSIEYNQYDNYKKILKYSDKDEKDQQKLENDIQKRNKQIVDLISQMEGLYKESTEGTTAIPEKITTFTSEEVDVSEESILEKLKKIHGCTK